MPATCAGMTDDGGRVTNPRKLTLRRFDDSKPVKLCQSGTVARCLLRGLGIFGDRWAGAHQIAIAIDIVDTPDR